MYGLKIAGTDQVSFGPVPVLMLEHCIPFGRQLAFEILENFHNPELKKLNFKT